MKEVMKRCLTLGFSLSYVIFAGFRRWQVAAVTAGRPLKLTAPEMTNVPAPPSAPPPPSSITFSGTVVRDGSRFALRDSAGALFALDSTGRAWPFEGEDVIVTGLLNQPNGLLHIRTIQSVDDVRAEAV
jgi:hypothetical protein